MTESETSSLPSLIPLRYRVTLILFLLLIASTIFYARIEPIWAKRVMDGICVGGILFLLFLNDIFRTFTRVNEGAQRLERTAMRQSIADEEKKLAEQRSLMERMLIAYSEQQEFPDFDRLRNSSWSSRVNRERDQQVMELIGTEARLVRERIFTNVYWDKDSDRLDTSHLLSDVLAFSESVALIYSPKSKQALHQVDSERLMKAINRASIELILLLENYSIAKFDPKTINFGTVYQLFNRGSKFNQISKTFQMHLDGEKALASQTNHSSEMHQAKDTSDQLQNPSQLLSALFKSALKTTFSAFSLELIRSVLSIIAWETVGMLDPAYRYRNSDWVYGVELIHLVNSIEDSPGLLRDALKKVSTLQMRSSYDQIFLYRCAALRVSPRPDCFLQPEVITEAQRKKLRDNLEAFLEKFLKSQSNSPISQSTLSRWQEGLYHRLQLPLTEDRRITLQEQAEEEAEEEAKDAAENIGMAQGFVHSLRERARRLPLFRKRKF